MIDKYIQALASFTVAYRALLDVERELPFGINIVSESVALREKIRELQIDTMQHAISAAVTAEGASHA